MTPNPVSSSMAGGWKSPTRCTFAGKPCLIALGFGYVKKDWPLVRYASLFYIAFYPDSFKMSESRRTDFPDFFCQQRWVTLDQDGRSGFSVSCAFTNINYVHTTPFDALRWGICKWNLDEGGTVSLLSLFCLSAQV